MAYRGKGRGDDMDTYNQGSEVPPPPSYDEAVQLAMHRNASDTATTDEGLDAIPMIEYDDDNGDNKGRSDGTSHDDVGEASGVGNGGRQSDDNVGEIKKEEELNAKRQRRAVLFREKSRNGARKEEDLNEIEMMDINNDNGTPVEVDGVVVDTLDVGRYSPQHSSIGDVSPRHDQDAESNTRRRRPRRDSYDLGLPIPYLGELINLVINSIIRTYDNWPDYSNQKRCIVVLTVLLVIGIVLLVSLLPASFVYVDYYELGFVHDKLSGTTDTSRVIQHGCYLFGPQHTLILFPATAHFLDLNLASINSDGLNLHVEVHFQYFLRPSELSNLFKKYDMNYHDVIHYKAETLLKTTVTQLNVEELRLNRSMVQHRLYQSLKLGLSGDCCHNMAPNEGLNNKHETACNASKNCNQGHHVDVGFFQLGALDIPYQVTQNYLRQFTLQLDAEKELQVQEGAVVRKETMAKVKQIENEAKEIREAANAASKKIKRISEAYKMKMIELSYAQALNATYRKLGITEEEEKLSLLYFRSLKDARENLYSFSYNYDTNTAYSP